MCPFPFSVRGKYPFAAVSCSATSPWATCFLSCSTSSAGRSSSRATACVVAAGRTPRVVLRFGCARLLVRRFTVLLLDGFDRLLVEPPEGVFPRLTVQLERVPLAGDYDRPLRPIRLVIPDLVDHGQHEAPKGQVV